jgi:hypothetical protein
MGNPPLNRAMVDAFAGTSSPEAPPKPSNIVHSQEARPLFRERETFQKMTVNMPKALYEELRAYMKLTDVPMSDVRGRLKASIIPVWITAPPTPQGRGRPLRGPAVTHT